ncbi:class I SAM-dependent methyltransferase [Limnobacter parvus]|uniref:Class I SAM-dependent methyltransferase n=1 Tax=Limnobacter parvus TaxID=2939690 RepID=A0ABT1XF40_9BURK|nr:class I SAM-dependent methyltransferase [Limnobacter parvus]MCR2745218.1 class I SAM-dependent methyltransferase [Limnobacter parvus]
MFFKDINEINRQAWLRKILNGLPAGVRLLDAGAGELRNRRYCEHLEYVSQDFCQYHGSLGGASKEGLHSKKWDTSCIDLVSDIMAIPAPDASFDVILCSEVLEHVPEPTKALDEFTRLLKPGGVLILTAPFASNVHMAPYHYCSGFSKYWYEYHLPNRGFCIETLVANGDWYGVLQQEIARLGGFERQRRNWSWPLAYAYALLGLAYFKLRGNRCAKDVACFGWLCVAVKRAL